LLRITGGHQRSVSLGIGLLAEDAEVLGCAQDDRSPGENCRDDGI